jgi:hypothetical protein
MTAFPLFISNYKVILQNLHYVYVITEEFFLRLCQDFARAHGFFERQHEGHSSTTIMFIIILDEVYISGRLHMKSIVLMDVRIKAEQNMAICYTFHN